MMALTELMNEDTDQESTQEATDQSIWSNPISDATVRELSRALDAGGVSTLSDVMRVIGAADTNHDSGRGSVKTNRRYDFSNLQDQTYGSICVGPTAVERLRHLLDQDAKPTSDSLVGDVIDSAYQDSKKGEAQRMVPFGVRLSSLPPSGSRSMEPSMFLYTISYTFFLRKDDTGNDDYGS